MSESSMTEKEMVLERVAKNLFPECDWRFMEPEDVAERLKFAREVIAAVMEAGYREPIWGRPSPTRIWVSRGTI